jgi:hypothetical protein
VSQHLGGGQVVDSDNLEALSAEHLAESQPADSAETIDSNFYIHWNSLSLFNIFNLSKTVYKILYTKRKALPDRQGI